MEFKISGFGLEGGKNERDHGRKGQKSWNVVTCHSTTSYGTNHLLINNLRVKSPLNSSLEPPGFGLSFQSVATYPPTHNSQ